ncbi:MAG: HAMP domain-containing histidine kinase [candidate division Zixibacteria bacterium]|nr:HAMP domain-containing histidine kinase [candidate division Zixibacteria bacterium]
MSFPLRLKFLLVAATVSAISLACSMWIMGYQLEDRLISQIGARLTAAQSTLDRWRSEREVHLKSEARIVAHDPRFFAAVAEGDAATTIPSAREFQRLAKSDLFLVADRQGRPLAHLDETGETRSLDWPGKIPPSIELLRWNDKLYLLQSQAVTVAMDTVGYVALGQRVDSQLAGEMSRVAGAAVIFFGDGKVFGSTLPTTRSSRLIGTIGSGRQADNAVPSTVVIEDERLLYRTGSLARDADIQYAVVTSLDASLSPQIASLRGTMVFVAVIAIALALVISWAVAQRVTARVPELVEAVEAVARGEYEAVVTHRGTDELSVVAMAVDRMRRELAMHIEAIRKANADKIASERMAIIGNMASTIIHDFKTPMQVIRSASELLSSEDLPSERRPKYTQMIMVELDRMVGMAHDLLGFARGERRMARSQVRIDEFIAEAVAKWQQMCTPRGITVEYTAGANVSLAIDREQVMRALDNITVNAMEVLSPGGVIAIQTSRDVNRIYIRISDAGPGIPDDVRAKLFEPFATFGKANGTGLGLATAKKTIENHAGTIEVDSAPGSGASFLISLPLTQNDDSLPDAEAGAPEQEALHEAVK